MQTKSLRLPEDLLASVRIVEEREHPEQAPAILRMGLETYVADLYGQGRITLRQAASRLGMTQSEGFDLLLERGVRGNLRAHDVLASAEAFLSAAGETATTGKERYAMGDKGKKDKEKAQRQKTAKQQKQAKKKQEKQQRPIQ